MEVINVYYTLSYSDTPICQVWFVYVKRHKSYSPEVILCHKNIKTCEFDLEVKVTFGSWFGATHRLTMNYLHTKNENPIWKDKKVVARTRSCVKKPLNLTLRPKVKVIWGSWWYATHHLMVIHSCSKYHVSRSKDKKVMVRTRLY